MESETFDLNQQRDDLNQMWVTLMQDFVWCTEDLRKATDVGPKYYQYWARIFTRTVFASIEGACEMFKQQALIAETNKLGQTGSFYAGKLSTLLGETYVLDPNGEIKAQPQRSSFVSNMLFSLKSYQEAQGVTHRTVKGDQWNRVLNAIEVRHRITHPKSATGIEISEVELQNVEFTLGWFYNEIVAVFEEKGLSMDSSGRAPDPYLSTDRNR